MKLRLFCFTLVAGLLYAASLSAQTLIAGDTTGLYVIEYDSLPITANSGFGLDLDENGTADLRFEVEETTVHPSLPHRQVTTITVSSRTTTLEMCKRKSTSVCAQMLRLGDSIDCDKHSFDWIGPAYVLIGRYAYTPSGEFCWAGYYDNQFIPLRWIVDSDTILGWIQVYQRHSITARLRIIRAAFQKSPRSSALPARNPLMIYPNPTAGPVLLSITDDLTGGNVQVIDTRGQLVLQQTINEGQNVKALNLDGFSPGFYAIKVTKGHRIACIKALVQP
jgi:hypothetical protein